MILAVTVVFLLAIGAGAMYGLWRLWITMDRRAQEAEARANSEPVPAEGPPEITEPLGPDGIAYLCAHRFVSSGAPKSIANARRRAYAPLTGDELEPRRMAEQIVHATLVSLVASADLDLRIAESDPSFMPPFPHKRWTLHCVRGSRLAGSPLSEALDCAFDIGEQRVTKKGGDVSDGIGLDELIEDMLKVMRQELSFWEKAGVYADIRQYVEAALIDQGYLIAPARETWFDRLRHTRPSVNETALDDIDRYGDELAEVLARFRREHGSEAAVSADSVPAGRTEEVDEQLVEAEPPFDDLPLHDCLRLSIYEAMMAIRQLEPSEDVGV